MLVLILVLSMLSAIFKLITLLTYKLLDICHNPHCEH